MLRKSISTFKVIGEMEALLRAEVKCRGTEEGL
jgi:hypothetical protein